MAPNVAFQLLMDAEVAVGASGADNAGQLGGALFGRPANTTELDDNHVPAGNPKGCIEASTVKLVYVVPMVTV